MFLLTFLFLIYAMLCCSGKDCWLNSHELINGNIFFFIFIHILNLSKLPRGAMFISKQIWCNIPVLNNFLKSWISSKDLSWTISFSPEIYIWIFLLSLPWLSVLHENMSVFKFPPDIICSHSVVHEMNCLLYFETKSPVKQHSM